MQSSTHWFLKDFYFTWQTRSKQTMQKGPYGGGTNGYRNTGRGGGGGGKSGGGNDRKLKKQYLWKRL